MKKIVTLLSSVILTISFGVSAFAADWETHWAADYIASARNAGWADMREKNNFQPANLATREEVIYMLYASQLNSPTVLLLEASDDLSGFTDTDNINSKYLKAFQVLSGNNLISGYADNTLKPKANITRAEMAKLVSYLIPSTVLSEDFYGYADAIPEWARVDIERCSRAGIISGYSDKTFRPSNYITRAEAVRMIQSLREFIATVEITTQEPITETTTKAVVKETTTESVSEETTEETTESVNTGEVETEDYHKNDMRKAKELLQLINNERFEEGANELFLDEKLCDVAFLKAKDMYTTGNDQKFSTTFGNLDDRLNQAGIKFLQCEMLVGSKISMAQDVVAIFENDSDTRELYLQSGYNKVGIGVYENCWAVIYIREPGNV